MKYLSGALKVRTKLFCRDGEQVAATMLEIGKLLEGWGDNDEAIECYQEVLQIQQFWLSQSHVRVSEMLNKIGTVHIEREEYNDALKSFQEALNI